MDDSTVILSQSDVLRQVVLIDAIAEGVTPAWTEAVAIVREVAMQLHRVTTPFDVPGLEDIVILPSGAVRMTGGRAHSGGPVAGVASVMSELLERGGAPPQVVEIQRQALASPAVFATLIDFHNALDYYARPDAQHVLVDYYSRAAAALDMASKNKAFDALKEKTKGTHVQEKQKRKKDNQGKRPVWMVAAAVVIAAGLAAGAAFYVMGPPSSSSVVGQSANAALSAIADTGKKVQDVTNSAISKLVGGVPEAAPPPPPVANASPAAIVTPRRRPAPTDKAPVATAPAPASPTLEGVPAAVAPPSTAAEPAPVPPAPAIDMGVYNARSVGVVAPVLVYPQLPSKRSEDSSQSGEPGELDMLVLEDGTVGEARLIPQSNRLQDRMMVSAAKAWRFRPAYKDGRAVRYRVRIPITW